jgi:hypothetical protein
MTDRYDDLNAAAGLDPDLPTDRRPDQLDMRCLVERTRIRAHVERFRQYINKWQPKEYQP